MTWPSNTANQAKRIEELETQLALALSVAENVNVQDGKIDTLEAIAAWNHRPTQDARVEALIESNKELTKFALYHAIHDEALAGIFLTGWGWDGKEVPRNFVERKRAAAVEAALKLGVSLEGK